MSEPNKNRKKNQEKPQKGRVGRTKGGHNSGEFRIGSRDILSTPEILSPFGFEEEAPKPRRGKKSEMTPPAEKPVAPTHNRKSKKKTEEPAYTPVKKDGPASRSARSETKGAAEAGKRALAICTISDSLVTGEQLSAEDRQLSFRNMMEIALEVAVRMDAK